MADTKTANSSGGGLKAAFQDTLSALGDRAMHSAKQRIGGLTDKLTDFAEGDGSGGAGKKIVAEAAESSAEGGSPVTGAVKGAVSAGKDKIADALPGKGGGSKRKPPAATKAMNFVDSIDVGVPAKVAFNQWTTYDQWPSFMKKVEQADLDDDSGTLNSKLHVFWFRRTQESTIQDQIPDERIVWRSKGQKGHVDGCVTFHEIGPRLTRILVQLEYYPQGLVERVGNIWRAQNRRMRLEMKHFRRHVMMHTILNPDEAEGWRAEVEDGDVIRSHDEVVEEEQQAEEESDQEDQQGDQDQQDQQDDQDQQDEDQQDDQDQDQQDQEASDEETDEDSEDEADEADEADESDESDESDEPEESDESDESDEDSDESEEDADESDEDVDESDEDVDESDEDVDESEEDVDESEEEPEEEQDER